LARSLKDHFYHWYTPDIFIKGESIMKKNIIVGIAMAAGVLTMSAMSASAAGSCNGTCADQQSIQQFKQETSVLSGNVETLEAQLREQYTYDSN